MTHNLCHCGRDLAKDSVKSLVTRGKIICSLVSYVTRGVRVERFISDSFRKIEGTTGFISVSCKIMRVCVCVCVCVCACVRERET